MTILITGVTRGLGRALAEWYISHGHTVIGCGRSGTEIFDLRFSHAEPHSFEAIDITEATRVEIWAERITGTHGAPELLINNAGLTSRPGPLWKIPAQEFGKVLDTNLKGPVNILRAFLPHMIAAKRGVVVNVNCASKWGIEGLTASVARDLPEGLAAVTLSPGSIDDDPKGWAERAAPFLLGLGPKDNGRSIEMPRHE